MTNKQKPEALRLAAWLNERAWHKMRLGDVEAAGRELRRLHAENERLAALVAAQQPAPSAAATLPEGWVPLVITHEGQYPEEVAYGPQVLMDRLGKWLRKYFDHVVASKAQPAPTPQADSATSAAAPVGEAPLPLLVRDIAADLGTTPIQVCTALAQMGFGGHSVNMAVTPRMAKSLRAHFASPTLQADSQPADDPADIIAGALQTSRGHAIEIMRQAVDADRVARIQTDSQPVPVVDYPPLPDLDSDDGSIWNAIFKWEAATPGSDAHRKANAVESAIITQLRAYVDADRAARAPADSVTAPAGGALPEPEMHPVFPGGAQWPHYPHLQVGQRVRVHTGEEGVIESLRNNTKKYQVLIRPGFGGQYGSWEVTPIAPTPPAQAADSVLEDAALPMQPICIASDGVIRFKPNRMVNDLYEFSQPRGFGLNEMARRDYTQEERMQFAQLIGYSVSGYGGLSYASLESAEKADAIADSLIAARKQGANHDHT